MYKQKQTDYKFASKVESYQLMLLWQPKPEGNVPITIKYSVVVQWIKCCNLTNYCSTGRKSFPRGGDRKTVAVQRLLSYTTVPLGCYERALLALALDVQQTLGWVVSGAGAAAAAFGPLANRKLSIQTQKESTDTHAHSQIFIRYFVIISRYLMTICTFFGDSSLSELFTFTLLCYHFHVKILKFYVILWHLHVITWNIRNIFMIIFTLKRETVVDVILLSRRPENSAEISQNNAPVTL